ncbi:hypothetical protein ABGA94_11805, partial [Stenotrophomonas sp. 3diitr2024]
HDALWRQRLDAWLAFGARLVQVLSVLLGVGAALVVGNTVRLDIQARQDPAFQAAYDRDLAHYVGRPSPIYHAQRLSDHVGGAQILLSENQSTYIPLGVTHRLRNPGKLPLELIEVQSGSYLGEDDIVRF